MKRIAQSNKAAWEEAFDRRSGGFGDDHAARQTAEVKPFLHPAVWEALDALPLKGGCIGQFCCNNGRELMSAVRHTSAQSGVGFDIAANILAQARAIAAETHTACTFVECDVCEAPAAYESRFDALLVTIGALCWMDDVGVFFAKAAAFLKSGGTLIVHDSHPVAAMFAVPQVDCYDAQNPAKLCYRYFRDEPFEDHYGMPYLAGHTYDSKTFTSYSHTLGGIVTAVAESGLRLTRLDEYDQDISDDTAALEGQGYPLSYRLVAVKP